MRKYFITLMLILAMLWIVPHAFGRWYNPKAGENVRQPSVFTGYTYSLLESSTEQNKTELIELTIEHYNPHLEEATQNRIIAEIIKASQDNNLDPFLVTAVIAAESSFKPKAKSHCGARGLMQLTRVVLPSLGVTDPFNIEQNIQGGCKFLGELYRRFGNTPLALAAYNAGPTRVARLKRVPHIRETQNYVEKVQRITAILFDHFLTALELKSVNPIAYIANLSITNHNISHAYRGNSTTMIDYVITDSNDFSLEHVSTYAEVSAPIPVRISYKPIYRQKHLSSFEQWSYFG